MAIVEHRAVRGATVDERGNEQEDGVVREWPDRGPWGNIFNKLLCVLAVAGIGLSVWAFVMEFIDLRDRGESRERITAACGGLIDPDPVLGLNGDGIDRVKLDDDYEISTDEPYSGCVVYRVGDPGTTYGHFSMAIERFTVAPDAEEAERLGTEVDEESSGPLRSAVRDGSRSATPTVRHAPPHPLGDGGLGEYDEYGVTARAICENGGKVSSIEATAVAQYDEPVTSGDRRTLAGLARQAADRAAGRTGCSAGLPELPSTLAEPKLELGPATKAGGTCAWYRRFTAEQGRGQLPDRALGGPAGKASAHDACVLAVGDEEIRRIWPIYAKTAKDPVDLREVLEYHDWWVKTETYVGDRARGLRSNDILEPTALAPGAAGTDSEGVWWASSVCGGRPAVHVMWMPYPYDGIVRDRLEALFRAYVDDATDRRGCTDVVFPDAADFARS
ncbi:hypothetical protein ACFWFI_31170 [Streptomyces sp. NPDC060209]|uniref:hypothetical protein n=1 Tax=Streptomyces sp. NPDC060209 TaxID=3347073 RepID=UPI003666C2E0